MEEASDEHEFSPKFEKRMQKLIRRRKKPYFKMINTVGKRVAVFAVTFLIISMTTVMSVKALREPFHDFIMSIFSDHSEVRSNDDSGDYPDKIMSLYEIKCDLSEYQVIKTFNNENRHEIHYKNNNSIIYFSQNTVNDYHMNYNTENAEIEHIDINGCDAIGFLDNNGYYSLVWNNGEYIIDIASNIGKNALIVIAKSVQKAE